MVPLLPDPADTDGGGDADLGHDGGTQQAGGDQAGVGRSHGEDDN